MKILITAQLQLYRETDKCRLHRCIAFLL